MLFSWQLIHVIGGSKYFYHYRAQIRVMLISTPVRSISWLSSHSLFWVPFFIIYDINISNLQNERPYNSNLNQLLPTKNVYPLTHHQAKRQQNRNKTVMSVCISMSIPIQNTALRIHEIRTCPGIPFSKHLWTLYASSCIANLISLAKSCRTVESSWTLPV